MYFIFFKYYGINILLLLFKFNPRKKISIISYDYGPQVNYKNTHITYY